MIPIGNLELGHLNVIIVSAPVQKIGLLDFSELDLLGLGMGTWT